MAYKTDDPDGILPTDLYHAARKFARDITGNAEPTMEDGLFIETFKTCYEIMRDLGMVKEEFVIPEKYIDLDDDEE